MKKAIIIGAGPAGLTAAYELLKRTDVTPIILEKSEYIGGISRTINYKGNRMDMGPHRFFSKSDRVMDWWLHMMPLEESNEKQVNISYQNKSRSINTESQEAGSYQPTDKKMLIIQRLTRIYFLRKFFAYPIQLSIDTLKTLGFVRTIRIMISFLMVRFFPRKPEKSLEDFIINKFGKELYLLFFKDYTEKVWGVPCHEISAEWGAQRIKGVSLSKAIGQAIKTIRSKKKGDISQKQTETSLIEQFLYPKYGPGSLWEEVARQIQEMGGKIYLNQDVQQIYTTEKEVCSVHSIDSRTGELFLFEGDYFFSSMPVQELIADMGDNVPEEVQEVAAGLQYRDFINVGILLKQMSAPDEKSGEYKKIELKDNWIYIQERDVKVGRLMIYNNWGNGMIKDPNTVWIGMEYFCNKTDDFWALDDTTIQSHAIMELEKMELARTEDILDITVRRMEKTYPAYFGTYQDFGKIRAYTDRFTNLFLVGRNGMHKYNNADHSMLTAMVAVDNIAAGVLSKDNVWAINTEQEYHEEKAANAAGKPVHIPTTVKPALQPGFLQYIWGNKWNRVYCWVALAAMIIQFVLFKMKYPFANYMPDSYSYIDAAWNNADVNMWPVAYSKFLRLVSVFTHSDKIVTGLQYFYMQISAMVLLFTLFYFIRPGKAVRNVLYAFCILNPVPLYVANYVSADALFIGTSCIWLSTLLFLVYQPAKRLIIIQGILLLACFVLRYNAIYYPIITCVALLLSRLSWGWRIGGAALSLTLVMSSILYTSNKMQEVSGKQQFSAFGGWQLANNAMYMYQQIPVSRRVTVPARFAKLEADVRAHMDTLNKVKFTHQDSVNSYFYLWDSRGPLIHYMLTEYQKDSITPYFKRWASEGPLYKDYAIFLMKKYPMDFLKSFLLPNAVKLAVPPTEFLGVYNMGSDSVGASAKNWFQYKSLKVKEHEKKPNKIILTGWYPVFAVLVNLLLLIHIIGLFFFGKMNQPGSKMPKLIFIVLLLWLLNIGFSVFASPIVLRYQVFPILIAFLVALLAGESIYKSESNSKIVAI